MARKAQTEAPVEAPVEETNPLAKYDRKALLDKYKTKSATIRHLHSEGLTTGQIAKVLGIRYQHARNVLVTPVTKKSETEIK